MAPIRTDDYTPVYDADAHICEPPSVWQEYCDPEYRDLIIQARIKAYGIVNAKWPRKSTTFCRRI